MGGLVEFPNPFDGASQATGLHRMTGKATSFDYPLFAGDIPIVSLLFRDSYSALSWRFEKVFCFTPEGK